MTAPFDQPPDLPPPTSRRLGPMRLRRVILLETVLVALVGFLVWGIAWELSFPRFGLGLAIVIWLTVSPAIEIATVMRYRQETHGEE